MRFAPDTEESLSFVVALCNTDPSASRSGADELAADDQLSALLSQYGYTGRIDHDEAELRDVHRTRALLRHVWTLDRDDAVEVVNKMLRDAKALPHLVRHDGLDWHMHATEPDSPLAERIRVEAALALIDVIRMNEMDRLRICGMSDCDNVMVDLTKNRSKRFCDSGCSNRAAVNAYRARRRIKAGA